MKLFIAGLGYGLSHLIQIRIHHSLAQIKKYLFEEIIG